MLFQNFLGRPKQLSLADEILRYENFDLHNIQTPIKADVLQRLLKETSYPEEKITYLINGFTKGFDIGYRGPSSRKDTSRNIPFTVGSRTEMWNKVMKEVKLGCYARPFESIPFENYMQSPIGLVPKGKNQTRLIFHLSYNFPSGGKSLNHHTPAELCSVSYHDLDHTVHNCLELLNDFPHAKIFYAKTDARSTFRIVPLSPEQYCWLVMKAQDPETGKYWFFIDKCLPFGASRSCAIFQAFSNALKHIMNVWTQSRNNLSNYLDDFLFIALTKMLCDQLVLKFLELCDQIGCPIAEEKTEWGTTQIIFLGIMLDGERYILVIPEDKRRKVISNIKLILSRKTVTIKELQKLCGTLNFLCRAIVIGQTFLRRFYDQMITKSRVQLKKYHHVRIDAEMKQDCRMWLQFLEDSPITLVLNRPFLDLHIFETLETLNFYTDSSANEDLSFGCVFKDRWMFGRWEIGYIKKYKLSIEYLELAVLCIGVITWGHLLQNQRIIIFCDNQVVLCMVNNMTSKCKNCMVLIRLLVLDNLRHNRRVSVKYVTSKNNFLADYLSRLKIGLSRDRLHT